MSPAMSLHQYVGDGGGTELPRRAVADTVVALAQASIEISDLICSGALAGITGQAQGRNADGDIQQDLDVRADRIIRMALRSLPIAALASEEAALPEFMSPAAPISVAIDPLDGSSNINTNMSVGTIFSIVRTPDDVRTAFMQPGTAQLAAGFFIYGPQTSLVLTLGRGVDIFTLDRAAHEYRLIRCAARTSTCAGLGRWWRKPTGSSHAAGSSYIRPTRATATARAVCGWSTKPTRSPSSWNRRPVLPPPGARGFSISRQARCTSVCR